MGQRETLQTLLEEITPHVYFQPPEGFKMDYPCIVYSRNLGKTDYANNKPYQHYVRYGVMVIDRDPDSVILSKVAMLPMCTFERHFTAGNLNHDLYNLYF